MRILELFAGSRSLGRVAEAFGHEVLSVDWVAYPGIGMVADVETLRISSLPWMPDMVWASPDCTTYTIAAISTHRDGTRPKTEYAQKCDTTNQSVLRLLNELLATNPKMSWFIENPRGMMRKMPWMQGLRRETVWYCQYGDDRAKPTDIWTNCDQWTPRPQCHNGNASCHHQRAPRGAKTGTQGRKGAFDRSRVPAHLCLEVIMAAQKQALQ